MIYIDDDNFSKIDINWSEVVNTIETAVTAINKNDFAQPIKPYLRFGDKKNRIIAMPAYVGMGLEVAGIKWIASFPDNIKIGKQRANSITILNDSGTGIPIAIFNTSKISSVRTAGVSAYIMSKYFEAKDGSDFNIGICGLGPIGRTHLEMCQKLFDERIKRINIFDINPDLSENISPDSKIHFTDKLDDAFYPADIFITSTVAKEPYIDMEPKHKSLQLNISLRDYKDSFCNYVKDGIIVDNWNEVCRENTDIERFHNNMGLDENTVYDITDVKADVIKEKLIDKTIMFNPMGMAVFDMAIAKYFYSVAIESEYCLKL